MITPYDILVDMLAVKSGKFTIENLKARLSSNNLMVANPYNINIYGISENRLFKWDVCAVLYVFQLSTFYYFNNLYFKTIVLNLLL